MFDERIRHLFSNRDINMSLFPLMLQIINPLCADPNIQDCILTTLSGEAVASNIASL